MIWFTEDDFPVEVQISPGVRQRADYRFFSFAPNSGRDKQ